MRRLMITMVLVLAACEEPDDKNAPPVGSGGSTAPQSYDPPDVEPEPEPSRCDAFQGCAVSCSDVVYGDEESTRLARSACADACERPGLGMGAEIETEWSYACAGALEDPADLCDEGYEFCLLMERSE